MNAASSCYTEFRFSFAALRTEMNAALGCCEKSKFKLAAVRTETNAAFRCEVWTGVSNSLRFRQLFSNSKIFGMVGDNIRQVKKSS